MHIAISTATVYLGLFIAGFSLSLLISFLKCSKISPSISAKEGAIWSTLPTFLYWLCTYSDSVRTTFSSVLESTFGIKDNVSVIAIGYVMMLGTWVMTTRMIHTTESDVCKPSTAELQKFKDDLEKELKEKQENLSDK